MFSSGSPPSHAFLFVYNVTYVPLWKRCLDISFFIISLPVVLPVAALLAAWIACVSPGRVLFRQERVGRLGRTFLLYKFRTMRADADATPHRAHFTALIAQQRSMQKLDAARDPRLIPGGWLIRATGLDELPQLINVLRGDMSLVGPRPCIPYEYEQYLPWQRARCLGVPGLTGLWQVSGKNRTTFDDMVRFDIAYNETKSLGLDLQIIARTLPALVRQLSDTWAHRRQARRPHSSPATDPAAISRA